LFLKKWLVEGGFDRKWLLSSLVAKEIGC